MSKGRVEKAEKVILRGAKLNGRRTFSTHLVRESVSNKAGKKEKKGEEEDREKEYSARDLFRGKEQGWKIPLCLCFDKSRRNVGSTLDVLWLFWLYFVGYEV